MSLRAKLALVLASLAALAAASVGWLSYGATRDRMLAEIDHTLRSASDIRADRFPDGPPRFPAGPHSPAESP